MTTCTCSCGTVHVAPAMATPEAIAESERHDRENRHKRAIIAAIREQRPGLIPDTLGDCTEGWFGGLGRLGIPAMESYLWRALAKKPGCRVDLRHWGWFATAEGQTGGGLCFGHDQLSLIFALCHALGIVLPEGGAP